MEIFIVFIILGFIFYKKFSKPKKRLFHSSHLVQKIEIKHIEILPCLKIPLGRKEFLFGRYHLHIHHWLYLGMLLGLSLLIDSNLFGRLSFLDGFFVGGIIQGLTYRDRFKLRD